MTTTAEPRALALARIREMCANGRAREIRKDARLALADVAAEVGMTPSNLQQWETGARRPTGLAALDLLELLDELAERYAPAA